MMQLQTDVFWHDKMVEIEDNMARIVNTFGDVVDKVRLDDEEVQRCIDLYNKNHPLNNAAGTKAVLGYLKYKIDELDYEMMMEGAA